MNFSQDRFDAEAYAEEQMEENDEWFPSPPTGGAAAGSRADGDQARHETGRLFLRRLRCCPSSLAIVPLAPLTHFPRPLGPYTGGEAAITGADGVQASHETTLEAPQKLSLRTPLVSSPLFPLPLIPLAPPCSLVSLAPLTSFLPPSPAAHRSTSKQISAFQVQLKRMREMLTLNTQISAFQVQLKRMREMLTLNTALIHSLAEKGSCQSRTIALSLFAHSSPHHSRRRSEGGGIHDDGSDSSHTPDHSVHSSPPVTPHAGWHGAGAKESGQVWAVGSIGSGVMVKDGEGGGEVRLRRRRTRGRDGDGWEEEEEEENGMEEGWDEEEREPTEMERYAEALPDVLDGLITEQKIDQAIELLEQGQQMAQLSLQSHERRRNEEGEFAEGEAGEGGGEGEGGEEGGERGKVWDGKGGGEEREEGRVERWLREEDGGGEGEEEEAEAGEEEEKEEEEGEGEHGEQRRAGSEQGWDETPLTKRSLTGGTRREEWGYVYEGMGKGTSVDGAPIGGGGLRGSLKESLKEGLKEGLKGGLKTRPRARSVEENVGNAGLAGERLGNGDVEESSRQGGSFQGRRRNAAKASAAAAAARAVEAAAEGREGEGTEGRKERAEVLNKRIISNNQQQSVKGGNPPQKLSSQGGEHQKGDTQGTAEATATGGDSKNSDSTVVPGGSELVPGGNIIPETEPPAGGAPATELLSEPAALALSAAIAERHVVLVAELERTAKHSDVLGEELRFAVTGLMRLGELELAHQLLLGAYGERIRRSARSLHRSATGFGGSYTAALSQIVFSAIAQATADSAIIFADQPACSADLLLWARREVTFAFSLLRRNILCSAASPGGLHAASECVCISLGHARLLEPQGICLAPMLGELMRPSVMEALEFNILRIEDAVVSVATTDEWRLEAVDLGAPALMRLRGWGGVLGLGGLRIRLTPSAQRFYLLLVDLVEDILPVISLHLLDKVLDAIATQFECFASLMELALPEIPPDATLPPAPGSVGARAQRRRRERAQKLVEGGGDEGWKGGGVRGHKGGVSGSAEGVTVSDRMEGDVMGGEEGGDTTEERGQRGRDAGEGKGQAEGEEEEWEEVSISRNISQQRLSNGDSANAAAAAAAAGALGTAAALAAGDQDVDTIDHSNPLLDPPANSWHVYHVQEAETEAQQLAVLGNVAALADELLPRLAVRLTIADIEDEEGLGYLGEDEEEEEEGSTPPCRTYIRPPSLVPPCARSNRAKHKGWRARIQRASRRIREIFCASLWGGFVFSESGERVLCADEYLGMDACTKLQQWMMHPLPSPPFQALFLTVNAVQSSLERVLRGQEGMHRRLLRRVMEWLLSGLLIESTMWEDIQAADPPLGPIGLHQLVFDMYFVVQAAHSGKTSSPLIRGLAEDAATRAIVAYSARTGEDPKRLVEEDWWYQHKCQTVLEELKEAASQPTSPTAASTSTTTPSTFVSDSPFSWLHSNSIKGNGDGDRGAGMPELKVIKRSVVSFSGMRAAPPPIRDARSYTTL
ncbi:unnamed protein product [Closterium sp. Naga37s-1]|nr:unnamed protein product [Closterium sp. Naga37s-1]